MENFQYKPDKDEYSLDNVTAEAFMDSEYVRKFIKKCEIDIDEFNAKYFHYMCQLDNIYKFCHDQMHSLAMDPRQLMESMIVAFGKADALPDDPKHYSWKYMKYYFKAFRAQWDRLCYQGQWETHSHVDNLWFYCRTWFCDKRMGGIICKRAQLVKHEFRFSNRAATATKDRPLYPLHKVEDIEAAFGELHQFDKYLKKTGGRDNDNYRSNPSVTAGGRDNDNYRSNPSVTAGGRYRRGYKDKPASKASGRADDDFKQESLHNKAGNEDNDELKEEEDVTAGGKYKHGAKDVFHSKANDEVEKAGDKITETPETPDDEEDDDDSDMEVAASVKTVDMSLCGTDYTIVE